MNLMGMFAAATQATEAAEETSQGISALGLDIFAILAQAATFLVLFWVVKKYALNGIINKLEQRRVDINRGLHLTAELDKEKAELDRRIDAALQKARKNADAIIADARTESGRIVQSAEESAQRRAEEIMRSAEGKIARQITDARQGLKAEMAVLVAEVAEVILREKLHTAKDRELIEQYLKEQLK